MINFGSTLNRAAIFRGNTTTWLGDTAHVLDTYSGVETNAIIGYTSTGVIIGTSDRVNRADSLYALYAMTDPGGVIFEQGDWWSDGTGNRDITTTYADSVFGLIYFQEDYHPWTKHILVRPTSYYGSNSCLYVGSGPAANWIRDVYNGYHTVGTSMNFALLGAERRRFLAILDTGQYIQYGAYTGSGVDDSTITIQRSTFYPSFIWLFQDKTGSYPVLKFSHFPGDTTYWQIQTAAPKSDLIQSISTGSFQIGTAINGAGDNYFWFAFYAPEYSEPPTPSTGGKPPDPCSGNTTQTHKKGIKWQKKY